MKWMALVVAAAALLIGLGLLLGPGQGNHLSHNKQAAELCAAGTADMHAYRLRDAVTKLGRSLELDPSLAEASIARSMAFLRLGEMDDFKRELARADSLTGLLTDPRRRMLAQLRLGGMFQSRYYAMADSVLRVLEQEIPDNIFVLVAQASRPEVAADPDRQEEAWLKILRVDPNYANAYNMLGYLELNRGHYDKAIEYMQKYAFLAPEQANPHDSMGEVLLVTGRYEEAEHEFIKSVRVQPDFYHSLINLGKVHLYRGQVAKGVDILEKVRSQVQGSTLERRVDQEIINSFVNSGLDEELGRMTAIFIDRYPRDHTTCFYRGIRLAASGDPGAGHAVMDSCLAVWRKSPAYAGNPRLLKEIDITAARFDAIVADYTASPAVRVKKWRESLDMVRDTRPFYYQWFYRYRLALALHDDGRPAEALAGLKQMLEVNPRLINSLILATQCTIELGDRTAAERRLDQLRHSLADADPDFYGRRRAAELAARIEDMPTGT